MVASAPDSTSNSELNQNLQQLIVQAQTQTGPQQRLTLNRLLQTIQTSGQLGHPQKGLWPPGLYDDLYQEALQLTLLYIATHLDQYDHIHPVMAWVNQALKWRFIDVARSRKKALKIRSLDDLEHHQPAAPSAESDADQLKQYLESDPIYEQTYIQGRPDASFRAICIMRIEGFAFVKIAADLNLKTSTVSQFFYRNWAKFLPAIQHFFLGG